MPHVFDEAKQKFVQVHAYQLQNRPANSLKKRQRKSEYVKFLWQGERGPTAEEPKKELTEEEKLRLAEILAAERKQREEENRKKEAARKLAAEEAAKKRKEDEERRRKEEEERKRQAAEQEKKRLEAEKQKEEEKRRKEEEKKKKQEEEAKRKKEQAEEERKKKEADDKKKKEEEEKKRKEAEEAKLKAAAEEKKRKEEEEERKRKEAEEAKLKAQAEEKKRKEEEEERKRKEAEEAKMKAEAEEKKQKEEEEERKRKEAEEAKPKPAAGVAAARAADAGIDEVLQEWVDKQTGPVQIQDFDRTARNFLSELKSLDDQNGSDRLSEALDFLAKFTSAKARDEVRKWPAYLFVLLKKFDPDLTDQMAKRDLEEKKKRKDEERRQQFKERQNDAEEDRKRREDEAIKEALEDEQRQKESSVAQKPDKPKGERAEGIPDIKAQAYRQFEDGPVGQMRAAAPAFKPGDGGWTVNLAMTNPAAVKARRKDAPEISAASQRLPTYQKKDWLLAAVRQNVVTVISGDTGCGKSTLIPQLICDAENLVPDDKVVVCTQPRRIAAITLAQYVAADRKQELGDDVGYQIRFVNAFSEHTRLIYATTAIILRRLHSEPELDSIGVLIVDEVHERDVYTDFVLLLLRQSMLAGKLPHLKLILMSATLKADDFASYFVKVNGDAALKPVSIPGRMFPVEDYYWEDACSWLGWKPPMPRAGKAKGKGKQPQKQGPDEEDLWKVYDSIKNCNAAKNRPGSERVDDYDEGSLTACWAWKENEVYIDLICELCFYFHKEMPKGDGAILIFLPGWGDIAKTFISLYRSGENFQLIALHSLMTPEQQQEAFDHPPPGMRKIVLSTNIAEASVTIDDVVYVIDCGVRKERNYDPKTSQSSLDTTMVTKANAIQRRGRAGRVSEGLVVHLFPSYKFDRFDEFPVPQMISSSMDEVVLQSKVICGGSNDDIGDMLKGSMAAPTNAAIDNAIALLKSMSCFTQNGELTALGRACAAIPVQPNVAKMLLLAGAFRCIKQAAVVAAFLSIKNPFQQSIGGDHNKQPSGPTGKEYFNRGFSSDHLTSLQAYYEWRREVKRGRGDQFCDELGLSAETMDMAHMMTRQFVTFMMEAGYDGPDVKSEDDYGEVDPIKKGSDEDALLRLTLTAGFYPNTCILYKGNRSPYWYTHYNEEVSAFRGSANADYQMSGKDGEEWMVYSDAMKMGRFNSIMDSTLVFSNFVLLFADALMIDDQKNEVRFDHWYACIDAKSPAVQELLTLRAKIIPTFKDAIAGRDLSLFSKDLTARMIAFCKLAPISLEKIEAVQHNINDQVTGQARKLLSMYQWPADIQEDD